MLTDPDEILRVDADLIRLTPREKRALDYYRHHPELPIADATAAGMMHLYLRGSDCETIRGTNGCFSLGAIVYARVLHRWDRARGEYLERLRHEVVEKTVTASMEGAVFSGDLLAVAHRKWGDGVRRFIQSGKPEDLPAEITPRSLTDYKRIVEIHTRFTRPMDRGGAAADDEDDTALPPVPAASADKPATDPSQMLRLLLANSRETGAKEEDE